MDATTASWSAAVGAVEHATKQVEAWPGEDWDDLAARIAGRQRVLEAVSCLAPANATVEDLERLRASALAGERVMHRLRILRAAAGADFDATGQRRQLFQCLKQQLDASDS